MVDWALNSLLKPLLEASNNKQFFYVVRSDNSFYRIEPSILLPFFEGKLSSVGEVVSSGALC